MHRNYIKDGQEALAIHWSFYIKLLAEKECDKEDDPGKEDEAEEKKEDRLNVEDVG